MKKLFSLVLTIVLVMSSGCRFGKEKEQSVRESQDIYKAYDFSIETANGKTLKLSDFRGKVVLLQFFATFCPPCKAEMPFLEELSRKYRGKVVVIGLSTDYIGENPSSLKGFLKEVGVTYPVGIVNEQIWNNYAGRIAGNDGIPQTYIIDKDGNVRYFEVGYTPQYDSLFVTAIEKLLKE